MAKSILPTWFEASTAKWLPTSIVESTQPKSMQLSLVANNDEIMPVMFMRYPRDTFRTAVTYETPATIVIDLVSVFPLPYPFAFAMPVIFDYKKDPFWSFLTLGLFPFNTSHGLPHVSFLYKNPLANT